MSSYRTSLLLVVDSSVVGESLKYAPKTVASGVESPRNERQGRIDLNLYFLVSTGRIRYITPRFLIYHEKCCFLAQLPKTPRVRLKIVGIYDLKYTTFCKCLGVDENGSFWPLFALVGVRDHWSISGTFWPFGDVFAYFLSNFWQIS